MKYYAVTDDPNELLHYGRLGMKWGQHIFVGPKSLSYKRALGKLRGAKKPTIKEKIQASRTQRAINKQKKQEAKFNNAVAKAQRRIALTEGFNQVDKVTSYERSADQAFKRANKEAKVMRKIEKARAKSDYQHLKNEARMDKYLERARHNTLKYGKLSTDQVEEINNRLALESNTRRLGGQERTWHQQKKEALRAGKLEGIKRGTAAAMEEVARAGAIYGIQNIGKRMKLNAKAKQEGKQERIKTREKNKKTHREIRQDLKQEAYKAQIEAGENVFQRAKQMFSTSGDKLMKAEAYKNIKNDATKLIEANKFADTKKGKKVAELEAAQREQKRLISSEENRKNDIDKKWQEYLDNGGTENFYDSKTGKHYSELKGDSKGLYEARANRLSDNIKLKKEIEENNEKIAYDKWAKAEQKKIDEKERKDSVKARDQEYYEALNRWDKNGRHGPKPRFVDYSNAKTIAQYDRTIVPTYDEAKIYQRLGLPSPLDNKQNKQNKGKKG